jgi:glycosyltransferase involved in cell wall biosynthesis
VTLPASHIAVSNHTKEGLESLGVPESKITVIPNGIDLGLIQGIPPSEESCDILFAGRLIKDKNVDILLEGIKEKEIKCCIIGDGPERGNLAELAKILDLEERVQFLGALEYEEVIARMKSAKVFVLPSTREGFGIVLLEAMAAGLPIIAVKAEKSAASEIVDGKNGILCELDELKENIVKLLDDIDLQKELALKGLETSKDFDWDRIADLTVKHLESVV